MPNDPRSALTGASDSPDTLQATVAAYQNEISARRSQLEDDLAIYQGKLHDLKRLDPLDFTGLQHLYVSHVNHIQQILNEFDDNGA